MLHISCNIDTCNLPDMHDLGPAALGLWTYISGKSLIPMLQLLHIRTCSYLCKMCACMRVPTHVCKI